MLELSSVQNNVMLVLTLVLFAIKVFALVDCVARRGPSFSQHDTLPKQSWLIILGLGLAAHLVSWPPISILNLLGTVAALVYLAQVRGSQR